MFVALDNREGRLPTDADVVVVGSGPAALPIVALLTERGARVVVLESGPAHACTSDLNDADIAGLALPSATDGRIRGFGGTGQEWSGQCLPMDDIDFVERAWVPGSGWPLGARTLAPFYSRAEQYFGIEGCSYDLSVHRRAGVRPPAFDPDVFVHRNTVYSPRHRVGTESRARLASDPHVTVVHGATVREIRTTPDRRRVVAVEAVGRAGRTLSVGAPAVVLACGAIENARLLLLSGDNGLGNSSGHVGRHFQEHPFCSSAVIEHPDEQLLETYRATFDHGIRHRAKTALAAPRQRLRETLTGTIDLEFRYPASSSTAAVKRLDSAWSRRRLGHSSRRDLGLVLRDPVPVARMVYRRARGRGVEGEVPSEVLLRVQSEQDPATDSRVTLSARRDRMGVPVPCVRWEVSHAEHRTTLELTSTARELLGDLGLGTVREFDWLSSLEGYRAHVLDTYHHAGTTRMAEDPAAGVVDPNCQVHGVSGLFVAGGSAFPTSAYANPTLTVVAMSLRLADHLAASL